MDDILSLAACAVQRVFCPVVMSVGIKLIASRIEVLPLL